MFQLLIRLFSEAELQRRSSGSRSGSLQNFERRRHQGADRKTRRSSVHQVSTFFDEIFDLIDLTLY